MSWLAAVLIVACSALIGWSMNDRLHRRALLLGRVCSFIEQAINSIGYSLIPPDRLICQLRDENDFFLRCRESIESGKDTRNAWRTAMAASRDAQALNQEERQLLEELGDSLGMYDAQGQLAVLRRFEAEFSSASERAHQEFSERSRAHMTCSLLAGVLIAIIII